LKDDEDGQDYSGEQLLKNLMQFSKVRMLSSAMDKLQVFTIE
jgi:hypothetical protein